MVDNTSELLDRIANSVMPKDSDFPGDTVREFLYNLFTKLWMYQDDFNSKRPWGNSGWAVDVHRALIDSGTLEAIYDKDGDLFDYDEREANLLIEIYIDYLFEEKV